MQVFAQACPPDGVERFGGHHDRTGSGCVRDRASTYTAEAAPVAFATPPAAYCAPDQAAVATGETRLGALQCEEPNNTLDQDNFTTFCLPARP